MHTFEIKCNISSSLFQQLLNLPSLTKVSKNVYRTNYYRKKGILQIELRVYRYISKDTNEVFEKYYLLLRCNAGAIMGENPMFALDLNKYTKEEIIERLQKRIYEINEFRFLNIHKCDMLCWKTDRVDITKDVICTNINPTIAIILCNLSFPFNYRKMIPLKINKPFYQMISESCYFFSHSRTVNIYFKLIEINNNNKIIDTDTLNKIDKLIRVEVQISKKAIYNLNRNKPDKRSLENFLDSKFCYAYLEKEMLAIFGAERHVNFATAVNLIQHSHYRALEKSILISILKAIHKYHGLYELEKAIADVNILTPIDFGNLRQFRDKLKKIRALGISPVTIPDSFGITEMPSIYQLLKS